MAQTAAATPTAETILSGLPGHHAWLDAHARQLEAALAHAHARGQDGAAGCRWPRSTTARSMPWPASTMRRAPRCGVATDTPPRFRF